MSFKVFLEPEAFNDIQEAIEYYNLGESNIGEKFKQAIDAHISGLSKHPFYEVRYKNVRCLPIKTFPYMIHFTLDESSRIVTIRAVFNTWKDPKVWEKKSGK